jgi:hypothetical protein
MPARCTCSITVPPPLNVSIWLSCQGVKELRMGGGLKNTQMRARSFCLREKGAHCYNRHTASGIRSQCPNFIQQFEGARKRPLIGL